MITQSTTMGFGHCGQQSMISQPTGIQLPLGNTGGGTIPGGRPLKKYTTPLSSAEVS